MKCETNKDLNETHRTLKNHLKMTANLKFDITSNYINQK